MRTVSPLSDAKCRNAKPRSKPYKLFDGGGLYLEVSGNATRVRKVWRLKYSHLGRESRVALGEYPSVSIVQARALREDHRRRLRDERISPADYKRRERLQEANAAASTFEAVAREWLETRTTAIAPTTLADITIRLEKNLFPWLGGRPIAEIDAGELLGALQRVEKRGSPIVAKRLRQYAGAIFRFAEISGRAKHNPSTALRGALAQTKEKHHAAITDPREIRGLLKAIEDYSGTVVVRSALKLAPMLFSRPGELRQAEWSELDLDAAEWRIPAAKMKSRRDQIVPLATQAIAILRELQPLTGRHRFVFGSGARPMSENTVNAALRRLGYTGEQMTGHGFRTIASTLLNEEGCWSKDAIERQLAHAERDQVRGAYNRAEFLPERRRMMQHWADYLDGLAAGDSKVVPIQAA